MCAALPVSADWKRDYDRGRKALEAKQWAEAEASFRSALREDGVPNDKKRFEGMRFDVYIPHYYAGLAAYRQGDCDRAMEYWGHEATKTVLGKLPKLQAELNSGLGDCQTRLAAAAKPEESPTATVAANVPPPSTPVPTESAPAGTAVAPEIKPTAAPTTVASLPPKPEPAKPAVQAPPTPNAAPAAVAPPPQLVSTLDAYIAGRYNDVVRVDPASIGDTRARAHVLMLRAASRFTLAQLAGDEAALEDARRDVRAARAAQGALAPDQVLFSPKFRDFYQRTR